MKLKKVFYFILLLTPIFSFGQGVSIFPTHLPTYIYDAWVNTNNEIILIVTQDYIVVQKDLYGYHSIVQNDDKLDFTCVNNFNNIKYLNITKTDNNHIVLDEGYKITKLTKLVSKNLKQIPVSLIDDWYSAKNELELKQNEVVFFNDSYEVDYVITSNQINYQIIIYKASEYSLISNYTNDKIDYLNISFIETTTFKKATFYQKNKKPLLAVLVLFVLIFSYFLISWKIAITKKKEAAKRLFVEMQLKSIRSQMNPHFLFNALSAIQNLINKGDNEKANHYLTEFSQLMRLTLDKSEKGLVPLDDEIKSIKKYLEIEKLRFHFDYKILTDSKINIHEVEIPAMLIQPIVENAIIHGLHQKKGDRNLWIEFNINDKNLTCIVTDNGVGINATKSKENIDLNRQKYGIKLAKDRINLINESYNTKAQINTMDLSDYDDTKTGTQVEISMPLKY